MNFMHTLVAQSNDGAAGLFLILLCIGICVFLNNGPTTTITDKFSREVTRKV